MTCVGRRLNLWRDRSSGLRQPNGGEAKRLIEYTSRELPSERILGVRVPSPAPWNTGGHDDSWPSSFGNILPFCRHPTNDRLTTVSVLPRVPSSFSLDMPDTTRPLNGLTATPLARKLI